MDEQVRSDNAAGNGRPWHISGNNKYLGIFWEGMPDLNFDEPMVRAEMIKIGKFWLSQGIDGFRLDAAKHIFGDFASLVYSNEVTQKNQDWWQEFRKGLDEVNPETYLIGEIWDSPAIIAPYLDHAFNSGFNFDLGQRVISAAAEERNPDLAFSLKKIYTYYEKESKGIFIDAPFLTNHDQNRVMSVLNNNVDHAKMAASVLLTLPGNPFLYYGEEIGMLGMKPDESIREPMPWYQNKSVVGPGQTSWETTRYNKDGAISVEGNEKDENSLLNRYRMLIQWRNEEIALRNGSIDEFPTANPRLSTYVRMTQDERVLVVHNMSGESQTLTLTASSLYGTFVAIRFASEEKGVSLKDGMLSLSPYATVILK